MLPKLQNENKRNCFNAFPKTTNKKKYVYDASSLN